MLIPTEYLCACQAEKWRVKAEMLQTRVDAVESELENVPRQWGSDMARLQIQLKEKDAQIAGAETVRKSCTAQSHANRHRETHTDSDTETKRV